MTSTHESLSSSVDLIASVASPSQLDTLQTHRISTSLLQNHQEETILDAEGLTDNQETAQIRLDEYQGKEVEGKGTQDKEVAIHPEGVIAQDQAAPEGLVETSMLSEQEKTEDIQAEKSVDNTGKVQIVEAESFNEVSGDEIDSAGIHITGIHGDDIDSDLIRFTRCIKLGNLAESSVASIIDKDLNRSSAVQDASFYLRHIGTLRKVGDDRLARRANCGGEPGDTR